MSDQKYIRQDYHHCLSHLNEELGELVAAIGKTIRWGWDSYNPELPEAERELNIHWVLREIKDVEDAAKRFKAVVDEGRLP